MRSVTAKPAHGQRSASAPLVPIVARYDVGAHVVRVTRISEGRYGVAVDEEEVPSTFGTQADAWEAGVREADRRNRPPDKP